MKRNPFSEIMDFDAERDEYIDLCKCKSKKYTYYSEWKQHIAECIQKITNTDKLEDFRHYCISRKRTTSKGPELFGTYIGLLIGALTGISLNNISKSFICFILFFLSEVILICYTINQHKKVIYKSSFFEDIIEIIEEIQNKK